MTTPLPATHHAELLNRVVSAVAAAREGRISTKVALTMIEREVIGYVRHRERALATRDAEVTEPAEGQLRSDASVTSMQAAAKIVMKVGNQRVKILTALVESGGRTDFQLSKLLRLPGNSLRPRRGELVQKGYVQNSGKTRKHRGNAFAIWIPTQDGRSWVARNEPELEAEAA